MPAETPPPSTRPGAADGLSDRLDSWKDVAAYLRRDVTTVQRWEKREHMPVHRHLHDRHGSVYAYRSEIDAWWRARGPQDKDKEAAVLPATVEGLGSSSTQVTSHTEPASRPRVPRARLLLVGVVALGVGGLITSVLMLRRTAETKPEIRALAVLPLDNVSDDPAHDYIANGMTDALITELGKTGRLRVIARASVMKYKGTRPPPRQVARELGVEALVVGSVRRSGDRVRITVQLIDPTSDRQTWSAVYERDLRDVLTLQREVTLAIAGQVHASLPGPEQARLTKLRPVNPEAFEAVLRARYLSVRTTDADTQAAIALLQHAVALDPDSAPAHAELASAYITRMAYVGPEDKGELEQRAFAAAAKALSLDPDLPEAYLARGDLLWTHSQRFAHERAAQEFRRALSLNPNSDQAHRRLARVYVHVGLFDEALQHAAIALAINPSNAQALNTQAQAILWMGKDEEALAMFLSIPGPVLPELVDANAIFALLNLGRRQEARLHLQRALQKNPKDPSGDLAGIEAMLLAESDPSRAVELIETVARREALNPAHHAAYFAACACARMGRAKEAVRWLREAAETGFPCYELFARDPNLDRIRQDPSFRDFMADLQKRTALLRKALVSDRP
jgi:TolB-like protein/tetratricopeptide (TPR) repeat protein